MQYLAAVCSMILALFLRILLPWRGVTTGVAVKDNKRVAQKVRSCDKVNYTW
jgi:hypothetical protein